MHHIKVFEAKGYFQLMSKHIIDGSAICFVGYDNYPVLDPEYGSSYIGGESVQQTLIARAFVNKRFSVSMVVKDHGQQDGKLIDEIKVWKTFKQNEGLPLIRFIYPRATKLWAALRKADADIYYQSCAGVQTGIVALFCRIHERKMVFRIAHDTDCIPGEELIKYSRDRMLYQYGLKTADLVVAQSEHQQELLLKNYGIKAPVINMAVENPDNDAPEKDIDILWVNNIRPFKRPELIIELARRMPNRRFVMIGGSCNGYESLYEQITQCGGRS